LIPDSTIAEIKNRIDIEEVVSDFVTLKKKGQSLWACCPFHNEKTYLARKYGIEVKEEELSADELREQSERESLYIVLNFAKDFFVKSLRRCWKRPGLYCLLKKVVKRDDTMTAFAAG